LPPTILSRDDKKAKKTAGKSSTAKTTKEQSDKVDKADKKSRKEKKAASKLSETASETAQEPAKAGAPAPTEEPEEADPDAEEATKARESPVSDDKSEEAPEDKPEDQSEAGGASGTATPKEEEEVAEQLDDVKLDGSKTKLRPPRTLETTLFDRLERLYGAGIKRVLKVQYRMNELIAEFPSVTLYNSELVSDASVAKHTLLDLPTITDTSDDAKDALEPTVVFFDTAGCEFYERADADDEGATRGKITLGEGSKSNENEATVVAKWARRLVSLGVPAAEVGIVAPYQRQVALLSSLLHEEFPEMTIGTVDGLQGQERDVGLDNVRKR
jgi:DNA polymerase alpha-associated DNA helicase A